jgi:hypothetical protein
MSSQSEVIAAATMFLFGVIFLYLFVFELLVIGTLNSISYTLWRFRCERLKGIAVTPRIVQHYFWLFVSHVPKFWTYRSGDYIYRSYYDDSYWKGFSEWILPSYPGGARAHQ